MDLPLPNRFQRPFLAKAGFVDGDGRFFISLK